MKKAAALILILSSIFFAFNYSCKKSSSNSSVDNKQNNAGIWPPGMAEQQTNLEENLIKKNYYVIFDASGSMQGDKVETAKKSMKQFISYVPKEANIGLLVFNSSGINEIAPLHSSRNEILSSIDDITAGGTTPLKDAITKGYDKLIEQGRKQLGYGEYNIVIVTDGEASNGQDPRKIVSEIIKNSPVTIHTIGFQIGNNHSLNQPGKIFYKSADNLEELNKGLEDVLAELEDFAVDTF